MGLKPETNQFLDWTQFYKNFVFEKTTTFTTKLLILNNI